MAVPARPIAGAPIETAWGDVAHDSIVAQDVQAGTVNVTLTAQNANAAPVVFARPFASAPIVVASANVGSGTLFAIVDTVTASGFNARLVRKDEATTTVTAAVGWIAYGPRT